MCVFQEYNLGLLYISHILLSLVFNCQNATCFKLAQPPQYHGVPLIIVDSRTQVAFVHPPSVILMVQHRTSTPSKVLSFYHL